MDAQPKKLVVAYLQDDPHAKETAAELSHAMNIPMLEIALEKSIAMPLSPFFAHIWNNWKELTGYEERLSPTTVRALKNLRGIDLIHVIKGGHSQESPSALEAFSLTASRLGIAVE